MPFSKPLCSLSSNSCYCLATRSHHSVCMLFPSKLTHTTFHFNLPAKLLHSVRFVQFPAPLVYSPHHFLSAHPSVHFASQLFPSTFSPLYTSNHTNTSTFPFNRHSFFQPSPTFTPLLFASTPPFIHFNIFNIL